MGLPVGCALVLSGHQADLWHPGILSKHFAAGIVATEAGKIADSGRPAAGAWLIVDHDVVRDPSIDVPVVGRAGELTSRRWVIGATAGLELVSARATVAPGAAKPPAVGDGEGPSSVGEGLERAAALLAGSSESFADATMRVMDAFIEPLAPKLVVVRSSSIGRTDLFARTVEAMARDPQAAIESYNQAAAEVPEAGLRPLDLARHELPLWSLTTTGQRRRVLASDLARLDPRTLLPRALLMTALLRLAGCELFVHGTGGAVYDRAMEKWMVRWAQAAKAPLPWASLVLAPAAAVTADLRLDFGRLRLPTSEEIARVRWTAHRARHDPALLGDDRLEAQRREILARLDERRRRGEDAAPDFAALHELLSSMRTAHAAAISKLQARATEMARSSRGASLAASRTWSSVLHPRERLAMLRDEVARALHAAQ